MPQTRRFQVTVSSASAGVFLRYAGVPAEAAYMFYETVYIDLVFLVNFMMDLLLLSLLRGILRKACRWSRLCAGALAGAVWACVAVTVVMPGWMELTGSAAAAMGMTALAFRERNIKAIFFIDRKSVV